MEQNEVFIVFAVLSFSSAILHYLIKKCLQSKCEDLNLCCGIVSIHRNAQIEANEHHYDVEHNVRGSLDSNDGNTQLEQITTLHQIKTS
jgi:hypothetical protein